MYTENVVDNQVPAGICDDPRIKKPKDGRWISLTHGDVSLKHTARKTTGNHYPNYLELKANDARQEGKTRRRPGMMLLNWTMKEGYGRLKERARQRNEWRH